MVKFWVYVSWNWIVARAGVVSHLCEMDEYAVRVLSQSIEDARYLTLVHGIVC